MIRGFFCTQGRANIELYERRYSISFELYLKCLSTTSNGSFALTSSIIKNTISNKLLSN